MSAADDVLDMRDLCAEIAAREVGSGPAKARISAVSRSLGIGWNRALEFLNGRARRVDAWEKDNARRRVEQLRRQEAVTHISNLNRTLAYLKTTDPDGYRSHIDSIERALAAAGVLDRPVADAANPSETTGDAAE